MNQIYKAPRAIRTAADGALKVGEGDNLGPDGVDGEIFSGDTRDGPVSASSRDPLTNETASTRSRYIYRDSVEKRSQSTVPKHVFLHGFLSFPNIRTYGIRTLQGRERPTERSSDQAGEH